MMESFIESQKKIQIIRKLSKKKILIRTIESRIMILAQHYRPPLPPRRSCGLHLFLIRLIGGVTEIIALHLYYLQNFVVPPTPQPHSALQSAASVLMAVAWAEQ